MKKPKPRIPPNERDLIIRMYLEIDIDKPTGHKYTPHDIKKTIDEERRQNETKDEICHNSISKIIRENQLDEQFGALFRDAIKQANDAIQDNEELRVRGRKFLNHTFTHNYKPVEMMGFEEIKQLFIFRIAYRQMDLLDIDEIQLPVMVMEGSKQVVRKLTIGIDKMKRLAPNDNAFAKLLAVVCAKNNHIDRIAAAQNMGEAEVIDAIMERARAIEKKQKLLEAKNA